MVSCGGQSEANSTLLYLGRKEVAETLSRIDAVSVVAEVLRAHAEGRATLPAEAYLPWTTSRGAAARSLNMPGLIEGRRPIAGTKVINSSLGNAELGLPRADGLTILFDVETARPLAVMDAALISAVRTAAASVLAVRALASHGIERLALLGCGAQAVEHLGAFLRAHGTIRQVRLYDLRRAAADEMAARFADPAAARGVEIAVTDSARGAASGADAVVALTTATAGYISLEWLAPWSIVVNVSLDDVLPDVVFGAALLVVDDWELVRADDRRLLGRMYRAGLIYGPDEDRPATSPPHARRVDGRLGEYLLPNGRRRTKDGVALVNPFGMAIEDIGLANEIVTVASQMGIGRRLVR
jgi:ornithine cyclodeaminase/alanine dehydrogenase-like protein (mu-crystallin family)